MRPVRQASIVIACILAGGCENAPTIVSVPSDLRNAPAQVSVGGTNIRLETYLWRDFQPVSPPDGKPLIAVLRLVTADGTPIPAAVHADSAWVLNGDRAWVAAVVEERPRAPGAAYLEVVVRDGPKWGPGIEVDVVVRLRDGSGERLLLQARAQPIYRTD